MDEETCRDISEFVSVLANPHRIRILCLLSEGELSVGEIAADLGLSPAHVSSHLRVLYDRGYVKKHREWRRIFYSLSDSRMKELIDIATSLALSSARNS
ncbi:MAG TPA: transcriptional regulator [Candidatus Acetothermia bacterium]|nr:transcriptional regulator [Candidatus Acetothermia bacterium]